MKHLVQVVQVGPIHPHPHADTLGITTIDGYTVVVKRDQWNPGELGVYIEPDYVVPDAPWAAMLDGKRRIRVKRLRGVVSQGLLLKLSDVGLPADTAPGTNVMETLGITRYEPPADPLGAEDAPAPAFLPTLAPYDLESWRKHKHLFQPDEPVVVTEKLHGESARFVWDDETKTLHLGSRTKWKRPDAASSWAIALRMQPWIEAWCRAFPRHVLYGEVFGNVPSMAYRVPKGGRDFRVFDVWCAGAWLAWDAMAAILPVSRRVPVIYRGAHSNVTESVANGPSLLAPHVREGFVVKPLVERDDPTIGRLALKCVGDDYHLRGE